MPSCAPPRKSRYASPTRPCALKFARAWGSPGVAMALADASEDVDERAVWLIAPIFDGETRTTSYVVLDGRRLSAGPVCELHLPEGTFVPWGLHGCWQEPASS